MGLLGAAYGWGGGGVCKKAPLRKICHTYRPIMKFGTVILYLNKSKKHMDHVTHPLSSAHISIFSPKIGKFCYIKKNRCLLYFDTYFRILLTFFESFKIVLIKMVTILVMSAKMATLGLLKIKVF